jgi:molecular chaperone HscB
MKNIHIFMYLISKFKKIKKREINFKINQKNIDLEYKNLLKQLHPDNFETKPKEERILSERYASLINLAYDTLKNPVSRAKYMVFYKIIKLKLLGENVDQENTPKEFLLEMLDLMEETQNENDLDALKEIEKVNNKNIEEIEDLIDNNFLKCNLVDAKKNVSILNYYCRLKSLLYEKFEKIEVEKFNIENKINE